MSDVQTEAPQADAAEIRATERIAAKAGWKPTDETRARELGVKAWKGDGHVSAEDYLTKRFSALDSLPSLRAKADKVDALAGKLAAIDGQLAAASRAGLQARMDDALERNDKDAAKRILQDAERQAQAPDDGIADTALDNEIGGAFIERNFWFGTNAKATEYAQQLIKEEAAGKGGSRWTRDRYEEAYEKVEQRVKARFPKLFDKAEPEEDDEPPARAKSPPAVGRGARTGATANAGQVTPASMTLDQQNAARATYVKRPNYSLDDHMKRYCAVMNEEA